VERTPDGYLAKVRGPQGSAGRFALLTPRGRARVGKATVRCVLPEEDKRQPSVTSLGLVASDESGALCDIVFRRAPAPAELREWTVRPGTLAEGLAAEWHRAMPDGQVERFPLLADADVGVQPPISAQAMDAAGAGPLAAFCGAYVENAFSQVQETWVDLATAGEAGAEAGAGTRRPSMNARFVSLESIPPARPASPLLCDTRAEWWLQTHFSLPFVYTLGCEPPFADHTILVLPLLPRSGAVEVKAWINGEPLNVQRYAYPRNRALGCLYADLVGTAARSGGNVLTVHYSVSR